MIDGDNWPIPKTKLIDGSNVAINNANRLLDTANDLYRLENPDYGACIFLTVIALEELGKGILLHKAEENDETIDKNTWNTKFKFHKPKIKASIDFIREFVPDDAPNRREQLDALNELETYSLEILDTKMASIYVDWNADSNNWDYFSEQSKITSKSKTEALLKHSNHLISTFTKSPPYRAKTTIALVEAGLAYAKCSKCDFKSNNLEEIKEHSRLSSEGHLIGFRETQDRSKGRLSF